MSAQTELFEKLRAWPNEERCRTCDCLQGALTQLEIDGDGQLKALAAKHRIPSEQMHACLGCDPCPPAEFWAEYVRESRSEKR